MSVLQVQRQSVFVHLLLCMLLVSSTTTTTEFVFNTNFNSTNLLLYGDSTVVQSSKILSLTNDSTTFSMGRALFPLKIPTKNVTSNNSLPFSTSFIFSMAQLHGLNQGHGFAFIFAPFAGLNGTTSSQHLGLFNFTNNGDSNNHVLGVEFDVFMNQEFGDINDNHVGLDLNSLTSTSSSPAGYWDGQHDDHFNGLKLKNGLNYQVWIDYADSRINVTLGVSGRTRPRRPLISQHVDLSLIFLDEMYVGFTGATGQLVQSHRILAWSFSNTNFSIGDALVTQNLPSFVVPGESVLKSKGFIAGLSVACVVLFGVVLAIGFVVLVRRKRKSEVEEEIEDWETEYWPHRISYKEIHKATKGFSDENVIGFGGNGKVYRGILAGEVEVAVKRISVKDEQGMREFLAEVSSLGRLRHRNLVGLKGWCKREKGRLILVYDYMQNGSLDKRLFECNDEKMLLSWEERVRVLRDVASGVLYLHEGWEAKVLHRDIKASNVLLDKEMNARLGDFGLAKVHDHGKLPNTTRVVGTVGYMAPEVVQTGRASTQTDVFGFGVLVLEVVTGRRPVEEGKPGLVEWVWRLMEAKELVGALDERLVVENEMMRSEVERVLYLGLACVSHDSNGRPSMAQVVSVLEGGKRGDGNEEDKFEEGMEVWLLEKMKANSAKSNFGGRWVHPTFQEVRDSSVSLSGSDILSSGR